MLTFTFNKQRLLIGLTGITVILIYLLTLVRPIERIAKRNAKLSEGNQVKEDEKIIKRNLELQTDKQVRKDEEFTKRMWELSEGNHVKKDEKITMGNSELQNGRPVRKDEEITKKYWKLSGGNHVKEDEEITKRYWKLSGGNHVKEDEEITKRYWKLSGGNHVKEDEQITMENSELQNGKHVKKDEGLFKKSNPLVIWANDFHIGPIRDLKHLLSPLGVKFIDKSLSRHCRLTSTCARNLRVINRKNGIRLKRKLISQYYNAYIDDPEMQSVDAFVCFHPTSMCEIFMPFNKSIIVIASTRYELGRRGVNRWKNWNKNLITISKDPKNVVGGNNKYDAKYIEYFTGIKTKVLTSFCGYIPEGYNFSRPEFLLAPSRNRKFQRKFLNMFIRSKSRKKSKVELVPVRKLYPYYKYSDLTAHKGIVHVPYQVSVMSLFEQYRMNIPLFFPSLDLLTDWQFRYHVMKERTWSQVRGRIPDGSPIPGVKEGVPDPNNEKDKDAIKYWIKYADFYTFPHIILYNSVDDLIFKMETTDLNIVSDKMKKYNVEFKKELLNKWKPILKNIYTNSANHK